MRVLENLEPKSVFHYFEDLCGIPHGSGNMKQISDYCVNFAKERGFECYQDDMYNVIIVKEATKGYEESPAIILQGHIDMVCEKDPDCTIDFMKDGLTLAVDGDFLHAVGTTLGGDNGIAVAMALAILADDTLEHPRLEAVFTTDEETGLFGAAAIDVSMLKAKKFINIDSEEEGIFTVSCAGGVTAECVLPVNRAKKSGMMYRVAIEGLQGGHSGVEIDKGRGNSSVLLARLLNKLNTEVSFVLKSIAGGQQDNAITRETAAEIIIDEKDSSKLEALISAFDPILKNEFKTSDPGAAATVEKLGAFETEALDEESTKKAVFMLLNLPNGIQAMSMDIPGLVETSLNLGILRLEEDCLKATYAVRSSVDSAKDALNEKLASMVEFLGGELRLDGDYPGWEYVKDSALRETAVEVYKKQYGKEPEIEAIHAGLECGIFAGKIAGLDCISIGPNMHDVHTTSERLSISSVGSLWTFLLELLKTSR